MSQDDYQARIIAAQQQWNDDRTAIYWHRGKLAQELEQGYDPPSITNPGEDLFAIETGTLQDLISKVEAMKPSQAWDASQMWQNVSAAFRDKSHAFGDAIRATVTHGWEGLAADQAIESVTNYVNQSQQLTLATELISVKLNELYTGLHQTQALMPRAGDSSPDLRGKTLPSEGVLKVSDHTQTEATNEARRVLRTVYWQVANQTDNGVPIIPNSPMMVSNPVPPVGPLSPSPGASIQSGTGDQPKQEASTPTEQKPVDSNQDPNSATQPAADNPQTTPSSTTTPQSTPQSNNPASTPTNTPAGTTNSSSPSTTTPATPVPSRSTTPGSPTTRSPGTTTSPGRPGRPSTPGSPGTPSPGRSIPGTPQQPGTATPLAARSSTSTMGRAGTSGTPMGGAPAKRDDEERTHQTKDYLIRDWSEELLGEPDKAVPPVIGEN
ncbi:hypothetical protein DFR70_111262 [Nocardia tenerifensis]|uniref:PPE family protein n=1 Tax=Nocardia tenerifensis TaxID=228006 RepID=A0A318JVT8_9NOCA|nr:hypothetical protein [Nocardia tenerifensis]PXX59875.1 hypothetical protein DFR70_111262 [Nocardia tenerifensis]